ncbi:MAG: MotA/TolQ/ExbB proton channel family protein, partial [Pirellulaceae bacterium]|nr:MotA/TolQ/ExbB proton channel family protein [Pirellulaceae bacterium]
MKLLLSILALSSVCVFARENAPGQTGAPSGASEGDLRIAAQANFESGEAELVKIRAEIEKERLPLNEELTKLEDQLVAAKKRLEERRRLADTLNLDSSNLNLELKVRSDENAYLANLLDEFVAGFESRLLPGEFSGYEKLVGDAQLAVENPNLAEKDRFGLRLSVLTTSLERLKQVVGGERRPIEVLDPNGVLIKGTMALIGPIAVFGAADRSIYGVVAANAESSLAILRPLDPTMNSGIADIIESGKGLLPFDPTRGGALQELIEKTSIMDTFLHGGPIMWPILACSIFAMGISLERILFLFREKTRRRFPDIDAIYELTSDGALTQAVEVGAQSKDFVARMLGNALSHGRKSLHTAIQRGSAIEVKRFSRGLWILDTCITMAPLLGLLGTVTGMMSSFDAIGRASDAASGANSVVGGIAEALIATAAGLLIAIASLIPLNYLNEQIEKA